jgi:hypothetical protein
MVFVDAHWKYLICIIAIWFLPVFPGQAQGMDPEIQRMTDELIRWTQEQFEKYGSVDPQKLDSMNLMIRQRQDELASGGGRTEPVSATEGKEIIVPMINSTQMKVPPGKIWKVKHLTCQAGIGEYSVLVTSVKFREQYAEGENITVPAFTPEASLLTSDMSTVTYHFKIIETEIK